MSGLLGQLGLAALMKGMGGGGGSRKRSYRAPAKKYARTIKRMKRSAPYVMSRKFPGSKYGYSATPRTADSLAAYGETYRKATDAQKQQRIAQRYFGKGAYSGPFTGHHQSIGNNVMMDGGVDSKPSFQNVNDEMGAIMITHHEYIKDIYGGGTSAFEHEIFHVNPGMEETFPWLAQVGANFEEYEFTQCVFEFRSTLGMSAVTTSGQVGQLMMAPQYNAGLADYPDKLTMLSSYSPVSGKTTDNINCGLECDFNKRAGAKVLRVRTAPVFLDQDIKTYDLCKLQVAQLALPATFAEQQLGELWVSYSVILRKPKLNSGTGNTISCDQYMLKGSFPSSITKYVAQQSNIGTSVSQTGSLLTITFPSNASSYYEIKLWGHSTEEDQTTEFTVDDTTGSVELVNDLFKTDAGAYTPWYQTLLGVAQLDSPVDNISTIIHVKCSTQYSGVASTLVIDQPITQGNIFLNICEYNTLNGNGETPVYLNGSSVAIVVGPP